MSQTWWTIPEAGCWIWFKLVKSEKIYQGEVDVISPELIKIAAQPCGAIPKVVVGIKGNQIIASEHDLPEGYEA